MNKFGLLFFLFSLSVEAWSATATSLIHSNFPAQDLPTFLVKNLDLASFRNSLGAKRQGERTFADLRIRPSKITQDLVELESPDWHYAVRVLQRGDINGDGIEDVVLCFTDRAKQGTYSSQQSLLVTRYSSSMFAIALHYEVSGCENFAR